MGNYGYPWLRTIAAFFVVLSAEAIPAAEPFPTLFDPPSIENRTIEKGSTEIVSGDEPVLPQLSVDYFSRSVENPLSLQRRHVVSVRAGMKLSLLEGIDLATGARIPILSAEESESELVGGRRMPAGTEIRSELGGKGAIGWRSDLIFKLGKRLNLNLFYDYTRQGGDRPGGEVREESIGTRFELRFR